MKSRKGLVTILVLIGALLAGGVLLYRHNRAMTIKEEFKLAVDAYIYGESSPDPGGLPYRWILKAMIPVGFLFIILQGIALSLHSLAQLLGGGED